MMEATRMIKAAYVLISSILSAALYTIIITVWRDRVMEMIYAYMPVPVESPYSPQSGYVEPITFALYAVPVAMVLFGFAYLALSGPRQESDTLPGYINGGNYR
jgi:ABC-type cobalt transport system substrate-binding protein